MCGELTKKCLNCAQT
jgi:long-subunit acyl-CoA synthetase (AMP-forming)